MDLQAVAEQSWFAAPAGFTHIAGDLLTVAVYLRDAFGNAATALAASLSFTPVGGASVHADLAVVPVPLNFSCNACVLAHVASIDLFGLPAQSSQVNRVI